MQTRFSVSCARGQRASFVPSEPQARPDREAVAHTGRAAGVIHIHQGPSRRHARRPMRALRALPAELREKRLTVDPPRGRGETFDRHH